MKIKQLVVACGGLRASRADGTAVPTRLLEPAAVMEGQTPRPGECRDTWIFTVTKWLYSELCSCSRQAPTMGGKLTGRGELVWAKRG